MELSAKSKSPVIVPALIVGDVKVLFVNVSVVAVSTIVPVCVLLLITGLVNVLFVNVSVVALPTNGSEDVGNVIVPVFEIVENAGGYENCVAPVPVAS